MDLTGLGEAKYANNCVSPAGLPGNRAVLRDGPWTGGLLNEGNACIAVDRLMYFRERDARQHTAAKHAANGTGLQRPLDILCPVPTLALLNSKPSDVTSTALPLPATAEELLSLVYEELSRMAAARIARQAPRGRRSRRRRWGMKRWTGWPRATPGRGTHQAPVLRRSAECGGRGVARHFRAHRQANMGLCPGVVVRGVESAVSLTAESAERR